MFIRINVRVITGTERLGTESRIGNISLKNRWNLPLWSRQLRFCQALEIESDAVTRSEISPRDELAHVFSHRVAPIARRRAGEREKFLGAKNGVHRTRRNPVLHVGNLQCPERFYSQRDAQ